MEVKIKMENAPLIITKHSDAFWRVTFDNPPINLMDPEMIDGLQRLMDKVESDKNLKVIVFDSADPDYFISHFDVLRAKEVPAVSGKDGFYQWVDVSNRLHKAKVISIASIRGRVRGIGSEFILACDMRFASKEKALFGQLEMAMGLVPGGGALEYLPRLAGRARALEIVLSSNDFDADTAQRYGWINRFLKDEDLDAFVNNLARRISGFQSASLQEAKSIVDKRLGNAPNPVDIQASHMTFVKLFSTPQAKVLLKELMEKGFQQKGYLELNLGNYLGPLTILEI